MPILAGGAAALTSLTFPSIAARAQAAAWREYRDEEMGFWVEFPAEFKAYPAAGEDKYDWVKLIKVETDFDGMNMYANGMQFRGSPPAEEVYKLLRIAMREFGVPVTRENQRTVSGVSARELIREADDINYIHRVVVVGNHSTSVGVFGERNIHDNATARRFLDSLTLLRGGR
jgi:hypothetical protein